MQSKEAKVWELWAFVILGARTLRTGLLALLRTERSDATMCFGHSVDLNIAFNSGCRLTEETRRKSGHPQTITWRYLRSLSTTHLIVLSSPLQTIRTEFEGIKLKCSTHFKKGLNMDKLWIRILQPSHLSQANCGSTRCIPNSSEPLSSAVASVFCRSLAGTFVKVARSSASKVTLEVPVERGRHWVITSILLVVGQHSLHCHNRNSWIYDMNSYCILA